MAKHTLNMFVIKYLAMEYDCCIPILEVVFAAFIACDPNKWLSRVSITGNRYSVDVCVANDWDRGMHYAAKNNQFVIF